MKFLDRYLTKCWTLVLPLLILLVLTPPVYLAGHKNAAWVIANLGTVVVLAGNCVYIVFFHSRNRWPNLSAFNRFARLITFGR